MIIGIGTDIVSKERIKDALQAFGKRFAERILSEAELKRLSEYSGNESDPSYPNYLGYLAKRFAAKEAVAKALGIGIGEISFKDIEITNEASGKPLVTLYGKALDRFKEISSTSASINISISDEKEFAIAWVIISN